MTAAAEALFSWLSGLGFDVYAEGSVPVGAEMPYATCQWARGAWGGGEVAVAADLWMRTESEAEANGAADAVSASLGLSGVLLPCDGGALWVKRGAPWMQALQDADSAVRRRRLNLSVEFLTVD